MQRVPKTAWHWRFSCKIHKPVPQGLSLLFPPPYLAQAQHIVGAHEMFVHWMIDPWPGGWGGGAVVGGGGQWKIHWHSFPLRPSATYSITYKRAFFTFVSLSHGFHPKPLILTHLCLISSLVTAFSSGDLWTWSSAAPLLFFFFLFDPSCPPLLWAALALLPCRVQPSAGPAQIPGLPGPMVGLTRLLTIQAWEDSEWGERGADPSG